MYKRQLAKKALQGSEQPSLRCSKQETQLWTSGHRPTASLTHSVARQKNMVLLCMCVRARFYRLACLRQKRWQPPPPQWRVYHSESGATTLGLSMTCYMVGPEII